MTQQNQPHQTQDQTSTTNNAHTDEATCPGIVPSGGFPLTDYVICAYQDILLGSCAEVCPLSSAKPIKTPAG